MDYTARFQFQKGGHTINVYSRGNESFISGLRGLMDSLKLKDMLIGNGYKLVKGEY